MGSSLAGSSASSIRHRHLLALSLSSFFATPPPTQSGESGFSLWGWSSQQLLTRACKSSLVPLGDPCHCTICHLPHLAHSPASPRSGARIATGNTREVFDAVAADSYPLRSLVRPLRHDLLVQGLQRGYVLVQGDLPPHQALIDRIVSVPDSLPFEQQVRLAEQERSQRDSLTSGNVRQAQPSAQRPEQAECQGLSAQAAQYDAMARQPQSGQMQDWITAEKRKVRDRQYALHC